MNSPRQPTRKRRPPAPKRDLTSTELQLLAEGTAKYWELSQTTPDYVLQGWRGLEQRTTRGLWRLWYDTFGSYPQEGDGQ